MPTVTEDLREGFTLFITDGGKVDLRRTFFCADLTGATPVDTLASALIAPGIPAYGAGVFVAGIGRWMYAIHYDVEPFSDADATVRVGYSDIDPNISGGDFGKCTLSGGTTLRQAETDFDAANLLLATGSRTPISVDYSGGSEEQGARVPILVQQSAVTFTRFEQTEPSGRSREFSGKRNASSWYGLDPKTVLCVGVIFNQVRAGLWETSYTFEYDPQTKFNQFARWVKPDGTLPVLTQDDVNTSNGIKEVEVQGEAEFNDLNLVIAT